MYLTCKVGSLVACLALLTAALAFTQAQFDEAASEAKNASPVAHVYVQTHKGVMVYAAAASGKLTPVEGSEFADVGQMEAINGKYLISVGTDYLHTYPIESDGAVGKQASQINTQNYGGAECGNTDGAGATLDHSGRYFYVALYGATYNGGANYLCSAFQIYEIAPGGSFTFIGDVNMTNYLGYVDGNAYGTSLPTFNSNDRYGYSTYFGDCNCGYVFGFSRTPTGQLAENFAFTEVGPQSDPTTDLAFAPSFVTADPGSHYLAALMFAVQNVPYGNIESYELASYTIDDVTGSIVSTNTWKDMPTPQVYGNVMEIAPSGKLLALAGGEFGFGLDGLQIFHFNGAAPITKYSALLLPAVEIDQLAWDNDNHLYALSYSAEKLYVYTVTPTSIKEVSGSPYKVENAYGTKGLIVVPAQAPGCGGPTCPAQEAGIRR